jgi:hypothetical protein
MPTYRFYPLDTFGKICGPYSAEVCDDDSAALAWAHELGGASGVEVWQGARLVGRLHGASFRETGAS